MTKRVLQPGHVLTWTIDPASNEVIEILYTSDQALTFIVHDPANARLFKDGGENGAVWIQAQVRDVDARVRPPHAGTWKVTIWNPGDQPATTEGEVARVRRPRGTGQELRP